jgi:2-dehydropantoate 2-reductase
VPDDIEAAMWSKFVLIVGWSGLGAITRAPVGVFRSEPETREVLREALGEAYAVGRARGVALPADCVESCLATFDRLPAAGTASMQRDIMSGRPSELAQQNGAVVRLGREAGVPTPANAFIYRSLLPLERRARGEIDFPDG